MRLHEWTDLTTPRTNTWTLSLLFPCPAYCMHAYQQTILRSQTGSSNFLVATTYDVGIRCVDLGHVSLQTALYFLVLRSRYVRAATRSAVDFTGKKVVSVVLRSSKSKSPVVSLWLSKESASPWVYRRLLGCSRKAPSAVLRLPTAACIAAWNQNFRFGGIIVAQTQVSFHSSTSRRPFLKKTLVGSSIATDGSRSANRKRPAATRRTHQSVAARARARQFSVDSQLRVVQSQAKSKTHVPLLCMSEWAIESRL